MSNERPQFQTGGIPIIILQVFLPLILAAIAGYGAVKYTAGEMQQQINELSRIAQQNREEINTVRSGAVSREEMRLFIDQARQDLQDIKSELRELRRAGR